MKLVKMKYLIDDPTALHSNVVGRRNSRADIRCLDILAVIFLIISGRNFYRHNHFKVTQ